MTVTVTTPPSTSPPNKYGGDPAAFDSAMQAHLTWMTNAAPELNSQNAENNAINATVNTNAKTASAAAAAALLSANNAAASTGAAKWVSGTTYTVGDVRWSPANSRTYRRIVAGAGTTDPASDATNWTLLTLEIDTGYPLVRPSLNLDFANSQAFDPRITFTRASTATRTNSKGLIETVLSGVPRIDYDPVTLECKGLLIEEARTNLLTYSEQFDNAAWSKTRATITANAITAPDGTLTADKLVEDTATGTTHFVSESAVGALTPGATVTTSCFVKAGERTQVSLLVSGATYADRFEGIFDIANITVLSTNAVGAGSVAGATITAVGNGWFRVTVTGVSGSANTSCAPRVQIASGEQTAYTGDGTSGLYIWGAQLE